MDGVQLPQGYSHFEEAVYFLPFSSQNFLVLIILSTSEGWKAESTVSHPSSDCVTIKMPYGVDVLHRQLCTLSFLIGWVKTESGFIAWSVEIGLGRWTLVVPVIIVDAYSFLVFSDMTCHLEDTGIGVFWLHCATW